MSSKKWAKLDTSISAAKPDMHCVIAFYNIGWDNNRFKRQKRHEKTLAEDIQSALEDFNADVLLLSECGEIGIGLYSKHWDPMIRRIGGPGFHVTHQGHYTSIVKLATMQITAEPSLLGPLTTFRGHEYRKCQHLQVVLKDSVAKPIDIYNVHSPASKKHSLIPTVRRDILKWFRLNVKSCALIGGDLNSSLPSLDDVFKHDPKIHYCYEAGHLHGDLAIAKGLVADSMPCEIRSTSKAHRMVVVTVTLKPGVTLTPRSVAQEKRRADKPASLSPASVDEFTGGPADKPDASRPGATLTPCSVAKEKRRADKPASSSSASVDEFTGGPADKPDAFRPLSAQPEPNADKPELTRSAAKPANPAQSPPQSSDNADEPVRPVQSYPLADALFKAIGEQLDAGETERHFFSELAEQLWRGNFLMPSVAGPVSQAYASKARLERMLSKVTEIRERYHLRMFNVNEIQDTDFKRALTQDEARSLHNAWMNDVGAWMSPDCLQKYSDLMQEADELDKGKGKGKAKKGWDKGKGKDKGSAAKPAGSLHGPRQQAHQLKKQRFNKALTAPHRSDAQPGVPGHAPRLREEDGGGSAAQAEVPSGTLGCEARQA